MVKEDPTKVVHRGVFFLFCICSELGHIACLGVIEYAVADISAYIAKHVVENNWVKKEDLVHYNLHADIDKQHAEEFFKIIESKMDDQEHRVKVQTGLRLGAYIFNRLYEDLYQEAQNQI